MSVNQLLHRGSPSPIHMDSLQFTQCQHVLALSMLLFARKWVSILRQQKQLLNVEQMAWRFSPLSLSAPWQHSLWYAETPAICTVQHQGEYWLFGEAESFCINCVVVFFVFFCFGFVCFYWGVGYFLHINHRMHCVSVFSQMWMRDIVLYQGLHWGRNKPNCCLHAKVDNLQTGRRHQSSLCSSYHNEPLLVAFCLNLAIFSANRAFSFYFDHTYQPLGWIACVRAKALAGHRLLLSNCSLDSGPKWIVFNLLHVIIFWSYLFGSGMDVPEASKHGKKSTSQKLEDQKKVGDRFLSF